MKLGKHLNRFIVKPVDIARLVFEEHIGFGSHSNVYYLEISESRTCGLPSLLEGEILR